MTGRAGRPFQHAAHAEGRAGAGAGLGAGVPLGPAFACKGGVCGTCRAKVTAGEMRMRRNYALEQSEVDAGFLLTCQSLPVSDTLTVDYDQ